MSETRSAHSGLTRRSFLKTTAAVAGAGALAGFSGCSLAPATQSSAGETGEKTCVGNCRANCHWACLHDVKVKDGVLTTVNAHAYPDPNYTSACHRGLSNVQRHYSPRRVKYPMRRVEGTERGAGEWERITWDEAIAEISEKLCYYRDTFGGQSIVKDTQSGNLATVNNPNVISNRLAACVGMTDNSPVDDRNAVAGAIRVLGTSPFDFTNEPKAVLDAKMIVVWGTNPCVTMPHLWRFMMLSQEAGAKIVCIDPVRSITSHKADQYIQVTPASDLYMILAMSNYIIENNLYDEQFLKTRTNAPFLVRRDNGKVYTELADSTERTEADYFVYDPKAGKVCKLSEASDVALEGSFEISGVKVDTAFSLLKEQYKQYTLAKATEMCGVPEDIMVQLAKDFATIGPVTIHGTYGLDHYNNGCMAFHAQGVLLALTGNFGRHGAGWSGIFCPGAPLNGDALTTVSDPKPVTAMSINVMAECFEKQEYMGKPHPLKAMISAAANPMSNQGNQNLFFEKVLPNLEFWVVIDRAWTDSALHADIVLPCTDFYECKEVKSGQNVPYVTYGDRVIDPLYEAKVDTEIFGLIGRAMGYTQDWPENWTEDYWIEKLFDDNARAKGWTLEELKDKHYKRIIGAEDAPGAVQGLEQNPNFGTKSGRVEIYWEDPEPREMYGQVITDEMVVKEHIPYWMEPAEAWKTNPLHDKYPLVLLTLRSRFRTHTQYFEVPVLQEIEPEPYIRIGRDDMAARGLENGDYVEVFNDRGHVVLKAMLDDAYAPGVVCIPKGWQRKQFKEGGFQELTSNALDPWGVGAPLYDCLVEIRKWDK